MGRMLRGLRIWRAVLTLLLFLWWDSQTWTYRGGPTPERRAARQQVRARWLTAELLQLGSAFIKLGQLLSARPDILPAGWVAELASLQDSVPAFPFEQVQAVLEEELGPRCAENPTPRARHPLPPGSGGDAAGGCGDAAPPQLGARTGLACDGS
jgi:predicted unusual protein kinase regulating ubiquinone biosynthesis (AarF/ABC1/UbiB family)